ncbi:MAG: ABC transporter substrate-binding protein [Thermomicrobiales bacterium]
MNDHVSGRGLTRRSLFQRAAVGAATPALAGLLTGGLTAGAAESGELAIAWNAPPPDFNPLTAVSRSQFWFHSSVMSSLVKPNPEAQQFDPDLADSWEIAPDGSAYTFTLRQNAAWHDGEPVTARDVAFTYSLALNPDTLSKQTGKLSLIMGAAAYTAKEAAEVAGIQVVDDSTIVFEMEFPNGLFLYEAVLPILPEHILGSVAATDLETHDFFINAPVGSGPFRFVAYRPDQFVEVEANPDYHFGAPNIRRIVFNIIKSPDTIDVAIGRDEIDLPVFDGGTAVTSLFEKYVTDDRFRIDATQGSSVVGYGWNFRHDYLADPRIHQAFLHAIDRNALIQAFNAGNGTVFNSFMTHSWYQKPEWSELYPYDPERARALLQEADWDSSRTVGVNVITLANEQIRAMVAAEQQMLADVGFNVEFQEMEAAVWVEKFYETYDFELVRVTFGVFADPDGFLNFHMKTTSQNAFGYSNPELDARIEEGRRAVDQEARVPLYQAINEEMLETLPVCPLYIENLWWLRHQRWQVPQLDSLPRATSIETIPVAPILTNTQDVWSLHQEEWTTA